jgi:hypothetical protein
MKTPVTTSLLSQAISKLSEHQRWFDSATDTTPSYTRLLTEGLSAFGSSRWFSSMTR